MTADARPYRRGVGAFLFNDAGRVWVGRRIDTPAPAWQMPQGGIKKHEDPRDAVLRELAEEIGTDRARIVGETADWLAYDLPPDIAARVWGGRYRGQTQKWFALRFAGADADIDIARDDHPEFSDWRWAAPATLVEQVVDFKRAVYAEVVRAFAPLIG